ncbi:FidL-like protein [Providencia sp. PROV130]|uniref:FidL-like protein n=1 Tax=Providencia sp. PROV130 TaxID=2949840 RepID=UPI00234AEE09|nr:FidL-like protein [Providencia sp. PROV130]
MTNKTLYSLILLFSLIIIFLLFNLNLEKNQAQYCEATVSSNFILANNKSSYLLDMKLVKNNDNSGYIKLLGTITTDKMYTVNRVVHFNQSSRKYIKDLKLTISYDRKSTNDNVPDDIFEKYFKAFNLNSIAYVEIDEITPDWYLFSSSFGPYFVCSRQAKLNTI